MCRRFSWLLISLLIGGAAVRGQETGDRDQLLRQILQRLDELEKQNRELQAEIKELKGTQKAVDTPALEQKVKVNEARIEEQAQTKVESAQKFPVTLSGTVLMNSFVNSENPSTALGAYGLLSGPGQSGVTFRQTLLGIEFHGPSLPGGGHVEGDLEMDFWAGPPVPSDNWLRIRRAGIALEWGDRSIFFGQDKPLISPYEPNSYAEVGVPSMAGTGNLWFWLPQARFEQQAHLSSQNGFTAQVALLQAGSFFDPKTPTAPGTYAGGIRPAIEGRVAVWHNGGEEHRKFEVAPGFHIGLDRVRGQQITSKIGSLDWLYRPIEKLEWKGAGYYGGNAAGLGSLGNGFYLTPQGSTRAIVGKGAWTQVSRPLNNRITVNVFGGFESDAANGLGSGAIAHSSSFAGNVMLHLSPNVLLSLEAQRLWTRTFQGEPDHYNHYDLAVAYLF